MKILVVKTKFVGDTVLTSAFLEGLRLQFPAAQVTVLASPLTQQVLLHDPHIDAFLISTALDSHSKQSKRQRWQALRSAIAQLRKAQFDRAYILTRSFISALAVGLARVPVRAGLATDGRRFLLSHPYPAWFDRHEYQGNLRMLDLPAAALERLRPRYWLHDDEMRWAQAQLKDRLSPGADRGFVFLHLSGSRDLRRWPSSHWLALARFITQSGHTPLWSGTEQDEPTLTQIQQTLCSEGRPEGLRAATWVPAGAAGIRQLAALIAQCQATVSLDTGPMHLSAALQIPTIGLFGPGDVRQWHPVGYGPREKYTALLSPADLPCRPCHGRPGCTRLQADGIPLCMTGLGADQVQAALAPLLGAAVTQAP